MPAANHIHNVAEAEQQLRAANEAYHNGQPSMSDAAYDELWRAHEDARSARPGDACWNDTILDKVGAAPRPQSGFAKVKHSVKMESLDNVFAGADGSIAELTKWMAKLDVEPGCVLVAEPKVDGLAVRLTYLRGMLTRAVTRGDGDTGDDVTANVLAAKLVSRTAGHDDVELNGEVFMTFADFEALNARQKAAGEEVYSNPRNAAAGILRRKDMAKVAGQGLSFLAHGVASGAVADNYQDDVARLWKLDIKFPSHSIGTTAGGVLSLERLQKIAKQPYPTDGVVIKVNNYAVRARLGSTSRAPRWAIAFKFQQEEVETTMHAITVQVGRSGVLTPVAELEPAEVDGSVVTRATLHNEDQVNRLRLRIGDRVIVRKAGAVIPELVRSITGETRAEQQPFNLIEHIGGKCPSCGSTDIQKAEVDGEKQVAWRCMNTSGCPGQLAGRLEHMASRDCLNLDQMGEELCAEIAARAQLETLRHPFDLLSFSAEWFAGLSWFTESGGKMTFGESRAATLKAATERAKTLPLRNWIAALGIHTIGKNTSKEISRLCNNVAALIAECTHLSGLFRRMVGYPAVSSMPEFDALKAQYGISHHLGPVSLMALVNFVNGQGGSYALSLIPDTVVSDNYAPEPVKAEAAAGDSLFKGKTVVLTGTISVPRHVMEAELEKAGARLSGSVSKKTDFLIAGEDCGSKLKKAQEAGVKILTEAEARAML
jgi:DNA ligase (NAD+)